MLKSNCDNDCQVNYWFNMSINILYYHFRFNNSNFMTFPLAVHQKK